MPIIITLAKYLASNKNFKSNTEELIFEIIFGRMILQNLCRTETQGNWNGGSKKRASVQIFFKKIE